MSNSAIALMYGDQVHFSEVDADNMPASTTSMCGLAIEIKDAHVAKDEDFVCLTCRDRVIEWASGKPVH